MESNPLTCKTPRGWLGGGRTSLGIVVVLASAAIAGCGPRPNLPALADAVRGVRPAPDNTAALARSLAPTLYLQPDESFPLLRVVAVHHPGRRLIAYHLLWRDDVHGAWIPFTTPTDQEIAWVEYDVTGGARRLYTYWHGTVVAADWRGKGQPAVDVQWGKHGALPRETVMSDLPWSRQLWLYYVFAWGLPDFWLGRLSRDGPLCFCGSYERYRQFSEGIPLADRIDLVIVAEDPDPVLSQIFGENYSRKRSWPDPMEPRREP